MFSLIFNHFELFQKEFKSSNTKFTTNHIVIAELLRYRIQGSSYCDDKGTYFLLPDINYIAKYIQVSVNTASKIFNDLIKEFKLINKVKIKCFDRAVRLKIYITEEFARIADEINLKIDSKKDKKPIKASNHDDSPKIGKSDSPKNVKSFIKEETRKEENILKNHGHQNNHETKPEEKEERSFLDELYGNDESLKIENVLNQQESEISNPTLTESLPKESTMNSNEESLNVIDLEYDPALDINNTKYKETTSYIKEKPVEDIQGGFDGSYDQIKAIEKLNDKFTSQQLQAINYFANEHNLDTKSLEEICYEKLLIESFNTFQELVLSSIEELEKINPRISNECDLNAVDLSEISKKPDIIDWYAIGKAHPLREGELKENQISAIHSLLDFLSRKKKIIFDYQNIFNSIYFQIANPQDHFKKCNFQRAMGIIQKLIINNNYQEAYGANKWTHQIQQAA